jgi:hypothetical protein
MTNHMIAMDGYREFLLGVNRSMLRTMTAPVLKSH